MQIRITTMAIRDLDAGHRSSPDIVKYALTLLRRAGFDYACFKVYSISLMGRPARKVVAMPPSYWIAEVSAEDLERSPYPELRDCRDYLGPEAHVFGIYRADGVLACVQCLWFGERYKRTSFWRLEPREAASVHLVAARPEQGKGLGTCLKQETAERMRQRGFSRLYSRIWWTNTASLRVSEKAGWSHVGTVFDVVLPGMHEPLRVIRRKSMNGASADTIDASSSRSAR
jgi:GNAT superfamily N-acetyltransferase